MASETILNGRYRLIAQQGSGGMAVIYKAIDQVLGRTVAIKILRPSLTADPAFLARFRNEARAVANLTHPNIVTVHDVGSDGSTHYMVMEFVEGEDLKKIIRTQGALPVDRALNLAIQICGGIGFAHRAGLVHADVKPQNILVTKEDIVKVTDFGIAQALTGDSTEKQAVVWGSPHYFAPEQARGEKPTPASDVYSIGIVMFEMLTGRLPYTGANQQELALAHIRDRVPMVSEFNPTVPDALARIVYKVMSKEPAARYRMADQLGHILMSYRDRGRENTSANAPLVQQRPPSQPLVGQQPSQPLVTQQQPSPYGGTVPPPQQGFVPVGTPSDPHPTQRYDLAPQAPSTGRPSAQSPYAQPPTQSQVSQPMPPQSSQPLAPQLRDNTGRFYSQPYEPVEPSGGLDVVTIMLAILAFFAVACLIPLYIAVFQARFGGG
jgi:eukaryotic-like serine/threonine-protein kinase